MRDRTLIESTSGRFFVDKEDYKKFSSNYKMMFQKIMQAIETTKDYIKVVQFGYDDNLNGISIQVYTTTGSMYRHNRTFETDHSNDEEVLYSFINSWMTIPFEDLNKEKYEGVFIKNGKKIMFSRIWGNYRFSDDECHKLLNGETIEFKALTSKGEEKTFIGNLQEQEYQQFKYYGFKATGFSLPNELKTHVFTEEEKKRLKNGEEIYIVGLYSEKKNRFFDALVSWTMESGFKYNFKRPKFGEFEYYDSVALQEYDK